MTNKQKKIYIYGKHAIVEALKYKPQCLRKVFLAPHVDDVTLRALLKEKGISVSVLSPRDIEKEVSDEVSHQGIIGVISPDDLVVSYSDFFEGFNLPPAGGPNTALVLLDEVQDPHNVGAIIRSAAAFGISGILIPEHNQAGVTGAVVKVSAGMAFRVPLISTGNVNTTLRDLKDRGFWVYGLEGESKQKVENEKFDAPTVFVFGNTRSKESKFSMVALRHV